jgi:hypothetical protein
MRYLIPLAVLVLPRFVVSVYAGDKDAPRFTIETAGETRSGCALVALEKLPRLLELTRDGRALPPLLTGNFLLTTAGDRIPLDPNASATLKENRLLVWPAESCLPAAHVKGLSVYVPNLAAVFWSAPEGVDDADLFFAEREKEVRKRDVAYLKNGDRIEGTLFALGPKIGCVMTVGGKRIETPWSQLVGLAWSTERAVRPRAKKPYARVVLEGGARVSFQELRFDEKTRRFFGKTLFGAPLDWPEENLLALDMRQDGVDELSELAAARFEHRPFLGVSWPLVKDAAATGQPLRLGGNTYEKGLGTHAACRVSYQLGGKYQRFDALVGLDEVAARLGRARVALQLDGKRIVLNEGKELTAKDAPLVVRQEVRGVRELTLILDVGAFGDVQANVNWAKARLIKAE